MRSRFLVSALAGLAASTLGLAAVAADLAAPAAQQCFRSSDWRGWKATPDSTSIYIRVGVRQLFRLDLSGACPALQAPGAHLVTKLRGSSMICSALDLDLSVSDDHGFATPCIVRNITPLSDSEAAALPKNLQP